jgi:hypothetical protein
MRREEDARGALSEEFWAWGLDLVDPQALRAASGVVELSGGWVQRGVEFRGR